MPSITPPPTDRLLFRPYRQEDVASVTEMFADDQARRFYPDMGQPGASARWIRWNLDGYVHSGFGLWVIEDRLKGQFLGDCGLTTQEIDDEAVVEVGYHLSAMHRGLGYATEASRACITYAFDHVGVPTVFSIVDPSNEPSIRVATRVHRHRRSSQRRGRSMLVFWTALDDGGPNELEG